MSRDERGILIVEEEDLLPSASWPAHSTSEAQLGQVQVQVG